ncbi:AsnC family protein [Octadecabacter temperatus]|uniref:Leucine-responsive regulatory protein n=1 Tax=Octadecabacter temperatus TaxID=1458307 RepID=A0A0K0Y2H6_9RHOB|nr:Lrp/AsnC ligand binding domain-containing protein [Octadecabacter temperatus]AKS45125.1 Leucine-responsive regulatory protein [Octadecabacter temperatus]SIN86647.1 AsnC family protein [Octadecabacter temperatus]
MASIYSGATFAAILDGKKLGLNALAHVQVSLVDYESASIDKFHAFIQESEQVLECASITGDFDYILKVAATDPENLEHFIMRNLLGLGVVRTTTTIFILRELKVSGALPVGI